MSYDGIKRKIIRNMNNEKKGTDEFISEIWIVDRKFSKIVIVRFLITAKRPHVLLRVDADVSAIAS